MKKLGYKKYLAGALIFATVFMFIGVAFAHAQIPPLGGFPISTVLPGGTLNNAVQTALNWFSCSANLFTCTVYGVSNVVNWILNLFVEFGGILISLGLFLDSQVFSSTVVQSGFSVSLAIANLGFVLGIIVIALATILRNETYGVKQMLWKLIVMAILVNFGLVICGPIVGLSDSFTNYFLNASGGASGFVTQLTTVFAPQTFNQAPDVSAAGSNNCPTSGNTSLSTICNQAATQLKGSDTTGSGDYVRVVLSRTFSAVFLAITALTFITIGILLVVRYVYLGILLILLPLAWLMWIFPKFNHHFSEWWSLFIKWALFPAISIFFVYLAFQAVSVAAGGGAISVGPVSQFINSTNSTNNSALVGFVVQSGAVGILQAALDALLMCGLCLGGLYAANAMSIKGADSALHAASWAGGHVKNYATKQTKKAARATYQGVGGSKLTHRLQEGRIGALKYIPFARRGASYAGQGLSKFEKAGGQHLVDNEAKWAQEVGKNPLEGARLLAGSLNTEKQMALLKVMTASKDLGEVKSINGERFEDYVKNNKDTFEKGYGQWYFYNKELNKAGGNMQEDDAAKAVAEGHPDQPIAVKDKDGNTTMVPALERLTKAMTEFATGLKQGDNSKLDFGYMFKKDKLDPTSPSYDPAAKERIEMFLRKLALTNAQLVPGMLRQMKGKEQKQFEKLYLAAIAKEKIAANPADTETLERVEKVFKGLLKRQVGFMGGADGGGGGGGAAGGAH